MTETILYTQQGNVGQLLLNNPDRHNSLGEEQLLAIQGCLDGLPGRLDSPRVLVVTGAGGRTFCAGAALQELTSGKISGELFQETTNKLAQLPIPTLAAVNGNAFGGGVELALSCDFRIGVAGSRFRVPAAAIGLCYPVNGIQRFVQRLGISTAKRLLLAAEELCCEKMLALGFLDYLVELDELEPKLEQLTKNLASMAPLSLLAMKAIIQAETSGEIAQDYANDLSKSCLESADLQEGFAAQREGRRPEFKGV